MSYTEDNEDLLGDILNGSAEEIDDDEPLEQIQEGDEDQSETVQIPQEVSIRKRVVRNPLPKLNSQRLSGPRGVHTLEQHFADFKFKGKHHEHVDLNRIMKRLEHWAHRLFPKYQFDDCIERLERLGKQRVVMSYMNMYRHNNLQPEINNENIDMNDQQEEEELAAPFDEIDELLDQQIALARTSHTFNRDATFDSLIQTPSSKFGSSPKPTSTPYHANSPEKPKEVLSELTEEQKERMALNRKRAQEKLLLKKQMEAEEAASKLIQENSENVLAEMDITT